MFWGCLNRVWGPQRLRPLGDAEGHSPGAMGSLSCQHGRVSYRVGVETAVLLPQMPETLLSIVIPSNHPQGELLPWVSP